MSGLVGFGVALPQVFPDGRPDAGLIARYAARAETLGFTSVWVQSQLIGRSATLDPITELAYAAAVTSTVGLGASVLIAPEYHPVQLAKHLSSVDQLSGGRLMVGLGVGSPNSTYEIAGMPRDRPVRRLIETVEVMRALWTQPEAAYEGQIFAVEGLPMEPKPVQRPGPPIWLGGRSDNALRRAARLGSGWMGPGASTMAMFRDQTARLRAFVAEEGRDPDAFTVAKRLYVTVDEDGDRARARMRKRLHRYGHQHDEAEQVAACGTPDEVRERIESVLELLRGVEGSGPRLLMLNPIDDFAGQLEAVADVLALTASAGVPG